MLLSVSAPPPHSRARLPAAVSVCCLLVTLVFAAPAAAACQVEKRASVPVRLEDGAAVVDVVINETSVPMILDTGADRTALTEAAVQRLGLPRDEWVASAQRGAGGRLDEHRAVSPAAMLIGGVPLRRRGLVAKPTLAVLAGIGSGRQAGLLGEDLLSAFELDLDLPARTLTLYSVQGCAGRFIPWEQPYDAVPVQLGMHSRSMPLVTVLLDRHPLTAVLDTGASVSFLNLRGMRQLGLTPAMLATDQPVATSVIGGRAETRWHRFSAMQIGPLVLRQPMLLVAPVPTPVFGMLVGLDVWATHRLWISYTTSQIFIARPAE